MCNDPKAFCIIYYCEFRECCGQEDKNGQRENSDNWIHPIPPTLTPLSSQNHFSGLTGLEPAFATLSSPFILTLSWEHSSFLGQGSYQSTETMYVGRYGTTVEKPTVTSLL